MNAPVPKYIRDIHSYSEAVPYGDISLTIKRVNRKTVAIISEGTETLRYTNNEEAIQDILTILKDLAASGYTGKAELQLEYKEGQIRLVGIHDKKEIQY